jgi:hypothetical protein
VRRAAKGRGDGLSKQHNSSQRTLRPPRRPVKNAPRSAVALELGKLTTWPYNALAADVPLIGSGWIVGDSYKGMSGLAE